MLCLLSNKYTEVYTWLWYTEKWISNVRTSRFVNIMNIGFNIPGKWFFVTKSARFNLTWNVPDFMKSGWFQMKFGSFQIFPYAKYFLYSTPMIMIMVMFGNPGGWSFLKQNINFIWIVALFYLFMLDISIEGSAGKGTKKSRKIETFWRELG